MLKKIFGDRFLALIPIAKRLIENPI